MKMNLGLERFYGHTFYGPGLKSVPTGIVLDVGGNRGEFCKAIIERYDVACVVLEPNPEVFRQIPDSPRIRKFQVGAGLGRGSATMSIAVNSECSRVVQSGATEASGEASIQIPIVNLEEFSRHEDIRDLALLKIDVEGAEIEIFEGVSDEFLRRIPQITIEIHDFNGWVARDDVRALVRRMRRIGFSVLTFTKRGHEDALFVQRRALGISLPRYLAMRYVVKYLLGIGRIIKRARGLA